MGVNRFYASVNTTDEDKRDGHDLLDGRAEDKPVAGDNGQAEESNKQVKEDDGQANSRTGRVGEGDATMELWGKAEGEGRAKEGDCKVEDGVVFFMIDGVWRQVPHEPWGWTSLAQRTTWNRCDQLWCHRRRPNVQVHHKDLWKYDYLDWSSKVPLPSRFDILQLITCSA